MASTNFLIGTPKAVRTETSLSVLAYNMKRIIRLSSIPAMLEAIRPENKIIASPSITRENRLP
jgi:hypothetical protein